MASGLCLFGRGGGQDQATTKTMVKFVDGWIEKQYKDKTLGIWTLLIGEGWGQDQATTKTTVKFVDGWIEKQYKEKSWHLDSVYWGGVEARSSDETNYS